MGKRKKEEYTYGEAYTYGQAWERVYIYIYIYIYGEEYTYGEAYDNLWGSVYLWTSVREKNKYGKAYGHMRQNAWRVCETHRLS